MTREQVETALDQGKLFIRMSSGRFWRCRRNGATHTWKTRPTEFRIPIKYGFKYCGAFTQRELADFNHYFRIGEEN